MSPMKPPPLPGIRRRYVSDSGYHHAFPLIAEDLDDPDFDRWEEYAKYVEHVKRGRFDQIPPLLAFYDSCDHWIIRGSIVYLLGDAGTDAILEVIFKHLRTGLPADYSFDFAQMLTYWGRLDIVPTLIRCWRRDYNFGGDGIYLGSGFGALLEETLGPITHAPVVPDGDVPHGDPDAYVELVLARHAELSQRYGERAFVFRGRPLDIEWIARRALDDLADPDLRPYYFERTRAKFEAMTGIDCTSMYLPKFDRLAAAAILEGFLASPQCKNFIPGRRYFFGREIPPGDPIGAAEWPPRA